MKFGMLLQLKEREGYIKGYKNIMKESHPELTDEELEEKAKEEFELIMKARKKPYVKQINELTAETTTLERELEQREQLGREIGCRRVAINMLIDDVPIEVISKYTELSIEEIKELLGT